MAHVSRLMTPDIVGDNTILPLSNAGRLVDGLQIRANSRLDLGTEIR
jgi:hypothetical protein